MVARKHERIAAELAVDIQAGRMHRGDQLPGETALAQRFSVSRNTIRAALAELAESGLIQTHSGKGSFVAFDGASTDVRPGWARVAVTTGAHTMARLVGITREADAELAGQWHLPSESVVVVRRIRNLPDGTAVWFERTSLPAEGVLLELPERGLVDDSVEASLAAAGLRVHHGRQRLSAHPLRRAEAAELHRRPGEWFLYRRRTGFDRAGRFVQDVQSWLDPRHFDLELQFTAVD